MRKILIVFTILFIIIWIYSSRKETFKSNSFEEEATLNFVFNDDPDTEGVQSKTIEVVKNMTKLSDVYNALNILEFEYDWVQTDDNILPDFKDNTIFKNFKDDIIGIDKTFFFLRQVNRTIISKELLDIFNDINDSINSTNLAEIININKINNNIDLQTSVDILKPQPSNNFNVSLDTIEKVLKSYKLVFNIPTLRQQERRQITEELYKKNEINLKSLVLILNDNTISVKNGNRLNKIGFNLAYTDFNEIPEDWPKLGQKDIVLIDEVVSTILKQHKFVQNLTGTLRKTFFINNRNKNLLIAYLLDADLDLRFLAYKPKSTTTLSPTTSGPTTQTPSISVTTASPTTQTPYVLDKDSSDFIRDVIIILDSVNTNYETIFENIFVDMLLFPELIGKDEGVREVEGGAIFKKMIEDALAEYEQKYVFVAPNDTGLEIDEILDRKNIFQVPEEKKEIEFKMVRKLNADEKKKQKKMKQLRKFDVKKIPLNFSKVTIDIMDDMIKLYSKEGFDNSNELESVWEKWKYYSTNTFMILTDNGRMFYVGVFFFVISILVYFSDLF